MKNFCNKKALCVLLAVSLFILSGFRVIDNRSGVYFQSGYLTIETHNETVKSKVNQYLRKLTNQKSLEFFMKFGLFRIPELEAWGTCEQKVSLDNGYIISVADCCMLTINNRIAETHCQGYNFSAQTGKRLKMSDVFEPGSLYKEFLNQEIKALRTRFRYEGKVDVRLNTDYGFYFSEDGMHVIIDSGEPIAAYEVYLIEYDKLRSILKTEYCL